MLRTRRAAHFLATTGSREAGHGDAAAGAAPAQSDAVGAMRGGAVEATVRAWEAVVRKEAQARPAPRPPRWAAKAPWHRVCKEMAALRHGRGGVGAEEGARRQLHAAKEVWRAGAARAAAEYRLRDPRESAQVGVDEAEAHWLRTAWTWGGPYRTQGWVLLRRTGVDRRRIATHAAALACRFTLGLPVSRHLQQLWFDGGPGSRAGARVPRDRLPEAYSSALLCDLAQTDLSALLPSLPMTPSMFTAYTQRQCGQVRRAFEDHWLSDAAVVLAWEVGRLMDMVEHSEDGAARGWRGGEGQPLPRSRLCRQILAALLDSHHHAMRAREVATRIDALAASEMLRSGLSMSDVLCRTVCAPNSRESHRGGDDGPSATNGAADAVGALAHDGAAGEGVSGNEEDEHEEHEHEQGQEQGQEKGAESRQAAALRGSTGRSDEEANGDGARRTAPAQGSAGLIGAAREASAKNQSLWRRAQRAAEAAKPLAQRAKERRRRMNDATRGAVRAERRRREMLHAVRRVLASSAALMGRQLRAVARRSLEGMVRQMQRASGGEDSAPTSLLLLRAVPDGAGVRLAPRPEEAMEEVARLLEATGTTFRDFPRADAGIPNAMLGLPEDTRRVLIGCDIGAGICYDEVADTVGRGRSAVAQGIPVVREYTSTLARFDPVLRGEVRRAVDEEVAARASAGSDEEELLQQLSRLGARLAKLQALREEVAANVAAGAVHFPVFAVDCTSLREALLRMLREAEETALECVMRECRARMARVEDGYGELEGRLERKPQTTADHREARAFHAESDARARELQRTVSMYVYPRLAFLVRWGTVPPVDDQQVLHRLRGWVPRLATAQERAAEMLSIRAKVLLRDLRAREEALGERCNYFRRRLGQLKRAESLMPPEVRATATRSKSLLDEVGGAVDEGTAVTEALADLGEEPEHPAVAECGRLRDELKPLGEAWDLVDQCLENINLWRHAPITTLDAESAEGEADRIRRGLMTVRSRWLGPLSARCAPVVTPLPVPLCYAPGHAGYWGGGTPRPAACQRARAGRPGHLPPRRTAPS